MSREHSPFWSGATCLGVGLVLSILAAALQREANDRAARSRLQQLAGEVASQVEARMRTFEYGLRGIRGVVLAHGGMPGLAEMRRYGRGRDIAKEFPGARGFGVVWRVAADEEEAHVARMAKSGRTEFAVRQLAPPRRRPLRHQPYRA